MAHVHIVVYVSNADSHEISVLELQANDGNLKLVERVPVSGMVKPLAINRQQHCLYAAITSEPYSVSTFAIDGTNGRLQLLTETSLPERMAYISTDRSGRYLFGASYYGNKITINTIGAGGKVEPEPLTVIATGPKPHCILTDLSNRFLFVSNLGADVIQQFRFNDDNCAVEPNNPDHVATQKGAGPRHLVFHHNRRLVFGTNELDGTVNTYQLNQDGTLTLLKSISTMPAGFNGKPWAADVHLTPNGKFLYSSERSSSTISAFLIDEETGELTRIGIFETERQPRGFNIDPLGLHLLVVGEKSNSLSAYAIDQITGELSKTSQINVGVDPTWVEILRISKP